MWQYPTRIYQPAENHSEEVLGLYWGRAMCNGQGMILPSPTKVGTVGRKATSPQNVEQDIAISRTGCR